MTLVKKPVRTLPEWDMTRCPECGKAQSRIRKKGEDCDNPHPCDCYVVEYRGKLMWTNPNWG